MNFDVDAVRKDFMILRREVNGKPLVYLDSAASAQKPNAVLEAMAGAMLGSYANVHRGLHTLANETTEAFEHARAMVAQFIGAPFAECCIFTKGATHAINIVAAGIEIAAGDEIVLSVAEHHSNIVPWHFLRERKGAVLRWVDIDEEGRIDIEDLQRKIGPRTKMVALSHMSNVLGSHLRAREAVAIARAAQVPVLLDGCQAVAHQPVDVRDLDADFYVFSGHKLYGPTGIGILYGNPERLERLKPFEGGGEMIEQVSLTSVTYNQPPHRFEAGTPPILEAIGLGAAVGWLSALDRDAVMTHERRLREKLTDALRSQNGIHLYGDTADKGAIVAFNIEGAHPHDVAQIVDREGVAIRAGHHCAQPLMTRLGVSATARASIALYNTEHDIDVFIAALAKARKMLA
jgi:cysteine desulfurase / selenocysteine lyase